MNHDPIFDGFEGKVFLGLIGLFIYKLYTRSLRWISLPSHQSETYIILILGGSILFIYLYQKIKKLREKTHYEKSITLKTDDSVYCGIDENKSEVWVTPKQRSMHTQVIGTTNAGKTESVILPWAIQDIHAGKGLLLIDGKADHSLIDKLWSYTVLAKREKDFKLFSLSGQGESYSFNPLLGGTAEEITERVFNAFDFENPYYRSLQYEVMNQVMRVFEATKTTPTFQRLYQVISQPSVLHELSYELNDESLKKWIQKFCSLTNSERETRTSGLLTAISHFSFGEGAKLFNPDVNAITIDEALKNNQILYFQLPVLLSPFLGKATGKLVLQSLQAAVANRHRASLAEEKKFFSVFLDDFSEYLYEGFISILNKSRSANVGIVFAHQALGDITILGDPVANSILTNANLKIFMRGNDPDSAEYFSKVLGTKSTTKLTERQQNGSLGAFKTGEGSVREVEEFSIHPNVFKKMLGVGEAIMLLPHDRGAKTLKIKFQKLDDLQVVKMPLIEKRMLKLIDTKKLNSLKEEPLNQII